MQNVCDIAKNAQVVDFRLNIMVPNLKIDYYTFVYSKKSQQILLDIYPNYNYFNSNN